LEPGTQIGPYKLLGILGEGGYGIVYLAQQETPIRRRVALKVIKPGMDSKQVIARFEAERQALALLDHPNLAHVYQAGTTSTGRPYFVMEYIECLPITAYCDREKLDIRQRLRLFRQVCDGVQHAHQKGIIHRDLKPSNILVTGKGEEALVKVIDFGIAKAMAQPLTEKTLNTQQGQFIGTPDYMSPEQAQMDAQGIDTRSDVYSLGVVLYEVLTGVLPFDPDELRTGGLAHIQAVLRGEEPRTPSTRLTGLGEEAEKIAKRRLTDTRTLARSLRRELEWIPLKAMRKEASRRYQSAAELASDIENYLNGAPLLAGPESVVYRGRKFILRHLGAVVVTILVAAFLAIGLVISTAMYFKAETTSEKYRQALYRTSIGRAYAEYELGNATSMLDLLTQCPADLRAWEWGYLRHISDESSMTLTGHNHIVLSVAVSPDGQRVASASMDKTIKIWDVITGTELKTLTNTDWVYCVAFSPDGKRLAIGDTSRKVSVWNLASGKQVMSCPYPEDVFRVSFSPDGKQIAAGGFPAIVSVWDAHTGAVLLELKGHRDQINDVAYSPDGTSIASASSDHTVRIWDAKNGTLFKILEGHAAAVSSVQWSGDGKFIFSGDGDGQIMKWDATTGDVLLVLEGHKGETTSLAYDSKTDRIASAGADCCLRVWNPKTGAYLTTLKGHSQPVHSVAFCAEGTQLVSGSSDEMVKVWSLNANKQYRVLTGHEGYVQDITFGPKGRFLASCATDGTIRIWDLLTRIQKVTMRGHERPDLAPWCIWSVSFSPDGHMLASGGWDGTVRIWDVASGRELKRISSDTGRVRGVVFARDGNHVVSGGDDKTIRIWDIRNGEQVLAIEGHENQIVPIALSPDGRYIASAGRDELKVWDMQTGIEVAALSTYTGGIENLAFSPDGDRIVSAGSSWKMGVPTAAVAKIWDARTLEEVAVLHGHSSLVTDAAFSPDGKRIVTTSADGTARIWDSATGAEVLVLRVRADAWPWNGCQSAAFSPDGTTLAVGNGNRILLFRSTSRDAEAE